MAARIGCPSRRLKSAGSVRFAVFERRQRAGQLFAFVGGLEQAEPDAHIRLSGGGGRRAEHLEGHRELLIVGEGRVGAGSMWVVPIV